MGYDGRGNFTSNSAPCPPSPSAGAGGCGTLLRRYIHGPGTDDPFLWYEGASVAASNRRYLMADERGSITSITDNTGAIIAINRYDEYGIPASTNLGRFGYTGQTWLPEIGMWHYKARIYSPTLGRFLQTDPIGYGDGMNMYAYVGGDPVNFRDPSGAKAEDRGKLELTLTRFELPNFETRLEFTTFQYYDNLLGFDVNAPPGSPCLGFGICGDGPGQHEMPISEWLWSNIRDAGAYISNQIQNYLSNCAQGTVSGRQVARDAAAGATSGAVSGGARGGVLGSPGGPAGSAAGAAVGAARGAGWGGLRSGLESTVRQACASGN